MKTLLRTCLLFLSISALGQTVYQPSEVTQPADPAGGTVSLNQFITANLQTPIASAAQGLNGGVFVKGVVEPDGRMTHLEVIRSIDSLTDREALRVLGLYRAWKPARLNGQAVRQEMTYPVFFRSAPIPNYDAGKQVLYQYFNKDHLVTREESKYDYRSVLPIDERGFVNGAAEYQQKRRNGWKTITTIPYERSEMWVKGNGQSPQDSVRAYRVSTRDQEWSGPWEEIIFQEDGKVLSLSAYSGDGKPAYLTKTFYLSGMLRQEEIYSEPGRETTTWYDNGQLHCQVQTVPGSGTRVMEVRDRNGDSLVVNGNGWAKLTGTPFNHELVYEEGQGIDSLKQGRWTGKATDSTLLYEEVYVDGTLTSGLATIDGQKVAYSSEYPIPPSFREGVKSMYQFLGTNVRYPAGAHQRKEAGKVVISFLVGEDGSFSKYQIEQSAGKSLDQEVLRVIKRMDGMWKPGTSKGRIVEQRVSLPMSFQSTSFGTVQR